MPGPEVDFIFMCYLGAILLSRRLVKTYSPGNSACISAWFTFYRAVNKTVRRGGYIYLPLLVSNSIVHFHITQAMCLFNLFS